MTMTDDDELPTYATAITRNPLPLLFPYLPPSSIFPLLLTSKAHYNSLLPLLYDSPHTFFHLGSRTPFKSLLLFLRTLSTTPHPIPWTRHLSLRTTSPNLYSHLPPTWLHDLLTQLPNLETLDLGNFPLLDHTALHSITTPHQTLHTLNLSSITTLTSPALSHLLLHLPSLRDLNLSSTPSAASPTVFTALSNLRYLDTLALQNLELTCTTPGFLSLLQTKGTSLRSLDLRRNLLTAPLIGTLTAFCVAPPAYDGALENEPVERGLTHLRICGNALGAEAVGGVVRTGRLVTLDVGRQYGGGEREMVQMGIQLVPVLAVYAFSTLRTLRIQANAVMVEGGMKRGVLRRLETLVLCDTPYWAPGDQTARLVTFLCPDTDPRDRVKVVELEMAGEEGEGSTGGGGAGGFSFFDDEDVQEEREERMEMLEEVRKARRLEAGRGGERIRVRVVRDLAGGEGREVGCEGERWGVVREGV
ncbi:hypothetical protein EX30DRAFT_375163 [Ascodesmis nigricans]|uniref:RNI-like protein n=1 Tax=Ascodesmis nigricans TaxID=341454 RepID=A0A4S2MJ47_9PEZI|nr:hypothetical protein EX30DRAFT_375163 [Ascodesmis nigricans]